MSHALSMMLSGNPLGLLIEEARTNLLDYSQDFTTG